MPLEMLLDVRFGYGADTPFIEKMAARHGAFCSGPDALILRTPMALEQVGGGAYPITSRVRRSFALPIQPTRFSSHEGPPAVLDVEQALGIDGAVLA